MSFLLEQSSSKKEQDSQWLSLSDLMTGLMMVFLLISVLMMRSVMLERDKIQTIAVSYHETQLAIYQSLMNEFRQDLNSWGASIDLETLTVVFNRDEAMFATGQATISDEYQRILNEFFPRYIKVIDQFKNSIQEVRLEGHTSSQWGHDAGDDDAYFNNLRLSQKRTFSVLKYIYSLFDNPNQKRWIKKHVAAVGYSSSKSIHDDFGNELVEQSKRVAFRIISDSEIKIRSILEQ